MANNANTANTTATVTAELVQALTVDTFATVTPDQVRELVTGAQEARDNASKALETASKALETATVNVHAVLSDAAKNPEKNAVKLVKAMTEQASAQATLDNAKSALETAQATLDNVQTAEAWYNMLKADFTLVQNFREGKKADTGTGAVVASALASIVLHNPGKYATPTGKDVLREDVESFLTRHAGITEFANAGYTRDRNTAKVAMALAYILAGRNA